MPAHGRIFLFLLFALLLCHCQEHSTTPEARAIDASPDLGLDGLLSNRDGGVDAGAALPRIPRIEVIGSHSTAQLIAMLTDPEVCPSGWTRLWQERSKAGKGEERLIPLQPNYVSEVDDFGDIWGLAQRIAETYPVLGSELPTMRVSVFWPCFVASEENREQYRELVEVVQAAGYRLELVLFHHASYPAGLHRNEEEGAFGTLGGWAHPQAPTAFSEYRESVLTTLGPVLPPQTVIYLAMEPVPQLLDGYIHREGKIPPGGRNAGRSLALALLNLRNTLREAGLRIRDAGFVPALGTNIRPLVVEGKELPGSALLRHLHNEWLTDALIEGCGDDNFDGVCEYAMLPAVDLLGVTFYGVMHASRDTTVFGLVGTPGETLARREFGPFDFVPSASYFRLAIEMARERYARRIEDSTLRFGIAEIGFSDGNPDVQRGWLNDYLEVVGDAELGIQFLGIHAPFEHAEFSSGSHYFHLIARCAPCELTAWGSAFRDQLEIWNVQAP